MKSVVVMGKGELAIRIADWFLKSPEHHIVAIVPVMPEPTWAPSLRSWAKQNGVSVIETGHYADLPDVQSDAWSADLVFSVFYDKIIKEWFIGKCAKILNLHNGPLPQYRGVSPINWALRNSEDLHGVTIHEITPGIDDGPIVGQLTYSIYPAIDEVVDVLRRSVEYGWVLFQQTIPLVDVITPRPQRDSEASYYDSKQNVHLGDRRYFTKKESVEALARGSSAT